MTPDQPVPVLRDPGDYTAAEMTALLEEGARCSGGTDYQAAVHLLTFTSLPGTPLLARNVTVDVRTLPGGRVVAAAMVGRHQWRALVMARRLPTTDWRLLLLATSLATARPVDLDEALQNMGHAHARRIAEAILIRCGAEQFYVLAGTGRLAELRSLQTELSGG
jgi:hypothetical protein